MATYEVTVRLIGSETYRVEADSREDAEDRFDEGRIVRTQEVETSEILSVHKVKL